MTAYVPMEWALKFTVEEKLWLSHSLTSHCNFSQHTVSHAEVMFASRTNETEAHFLSRYSLPLVPVANSACLRHLVYMAGRQTAVLCVVSFWLALATRGFGMGFYCERGHNA